MDGFGSGARALALGEMRREMAKKGRLLDYPIGLDAVALAPDEIQDFHDIVEMALRIDPARGLPNMTLPSSTARMPPSR